MQPTKPCYVPNEDISAHERLFIVMTILFSIKLRGIIPNLSACIKEKGIKRTLLHV